jgi:hypothetical protein
VSIVRADALGSGEVLGMDLVRALIGLTRSLEWESMIAGAKGRPDMTLEIVQAENGRGAWILFDATLVPELKLAREVDRKLRKRR